MLKFGSAPLSAYFTTIICRNVDTQINKY